MADLEQLTTHDICALRMLARGGSWTAHELRREVGAQHADAVELRLPGLVKRQLVLLERHVAYRITSAGKDRLVMAEAA